MSEIGDEEVEVLDARLPVNTGAAGHRWPSKYRTILTLTAVAKSWLRRARVILEAVHEAIIVQMKREYVVEKIGPVLPVGAMVAAKLAKPTKGHRCYSTDSCDLTESQ